MERVGSGAPERGDSGASEHLTAGGGVRVENILQRRILRDGDRFQGAGDQTRNVVKADFVPEIELHGLFIRGVENRAGRAARLDRLLRQP